MEKIFSCTAQTVSSALKAPHSCANSHLMNFQQQFKEKISGKQLPQVACHTQQHAVEKRARQKLNTTLCSNLQIGALNPFVATVPFWLSLTLPLSHSLVSLSFAVKSKTFPPCFVFLLVLWLSNFKLLNCSAQKKENRTNEHLEKFTPLLHFIEFAFLIVSIDNNFDNHSLLNDNQYNCTAHITLVTLCPGKFA